MFSKSTSSQQHQTDRTGRPREPQDVKAIADWVGFVIADMKRRAALSGVSAGSLLARDDCAQAVRQFTSAWAEDLDHSPCEPTSSSGNDDPNDERILNAIRDNNRPEMVMGLLFFAAMAIDTDRIATLSNAAVNTLAGRYEPETCQLYNDVAIDLVLGGKREMMEYYKSTYGRYRYPHVPKGKPSSWEFDALDFSTSPEILRAFEGLDECVLSSLYESGLIDVRQQKIILTESGCRLLDWTSGY